MTNSNTSISASTKVSADKPNGWKSTELGNIPHHWDLIPARKFCTKVADGTHDTPKPKEKGKYLVTSKHIKNGKVDLSSAYMISNEDFFEINKRSKVDQWDVLLSMIGTVGEICLIDEIPDFAIKNVGLFKCDEEYKAKWLYYFLRSKTGQHEIQRKMTGTTQSYITLGSLRNFPIIIPEKKEELKNIVTVLSSLDNKIELLREENKTLETLAQTIFKQWFVKFNFPDKNGKPYKNNGGKMIDSELGEIPEGWRVGRLSDIANFLNGLALQKYPAESNTNYLPVIKIKELNSGISTQTDKASTKLEEKYIVNNGDILFSWSGSLMVDIWQHGKGALNQHLFKVTSSKYHKWFYFYWIKKHLPNFKQIATAKAVTMGHIKRHHLDDALVSIPNSEFIENANSVFDPILDKLINNHSQIQSLAKTRDTLLPKLMRGEIRVKGFKN